MARVSLMPKTPNSKARNGFRAFAVFLLESGTGCQDFVLQLHYQGSMLYCL